MSNSKFIALDLACNRKRVDDETNERKTTTAFLMPQFGRIAALGHDFDMGEVCDASGD
jgi:hypothetical protein